MQSSLSLFRAASCNVNDEPEARDGCGKGPRVLCQRVKVPYIDDPGRTVTEDKKRKHDRYWHGAWNEAM
jgi:hypothetical protein